jgi:peptide/nickel transport system permease protein
MSADLLAGGAAPAPPDPPAGRSGLPGRSRLSGIARYLGRSLLKLVLTLLAISVVVYGLAAAAGNPAHDILGMDATPEQIAAFTAAHHLDDPFPLRYAKWLWGVLHGDFGISYQSNGPVWDVIQPRIGDSLVLIVLSGFLIVVVSIPVGLLAGVRLRGRSDVVATLITLVIAAFPEFVIGLLLIVVFAAKLRWFPVDSTALNFGGLFDSPSAYVLPAITISLGSIPYLVRLMRANAREVAGETYIRSAVLRGISEPALSLRHVLPNAAPPIVTALGLQLAGLVGGVIVAETLFGFPGIGQLIAKSAASRDAPVVEALALVIGAVFVIVNLLADAVVVMLTPKLRDRVR